MAPPATTVTSATAPTLVQRLKKKSQKVTEGVSQTSKKETNTPKGPIIIPNPLFSINRPQIHHDNGSVINSSYIPTTASHSEKPLKDSFSQRRYRHLSAINSSTISRRPTKAQEDRLGERLTEIFNQHPAFNQTSTKKFWYYQIASEKQRFQYPIISRHNLYVLQNYLHRRSRVYKEKHTIFAFSSNPLVWFPIRSCICFLAWLLIFGTASVVISGHVLVVSLVNTSYHLLVALLLIIFDWEDICAVCFPGWLLSLSHRFHCISCWIDEYILQGRRFAGREWNEHDYCFKYPSYFGNKSANHFSSLNYDSKKSRNNATEISSCSSRHMTLWELPPPAVKQGKRLCLSWEYLIAHNNWSRPTVDHMVAVNFCYVMLREEDLRNQARLQIQKQRNSQSRKKSTALSVFPLSDSGLRSALRNRQHLSSNRSENQGCYSFVDVEETSPLVVEPQAIELKLSETFDDLPAASPGYFDNLNKSILCADYGDLLKDKNYCSDESVASNLADHAADLPWLDVGAKIGMRLLNSAHVHRAMSSQEAASRIMHIGNFDGNFLGGGCTVDEDSFAPPTPDDNRERRVEQDVAASITRLPKPIHSMWTSPGAAASNTLCSLLSDNDESFGGENSTISSSVPFNNVGSPFDAYYSTLSPKSPSSPMQAAAQSKICSWPQDCTPRYPSQQSDSSPYRVGMVPLENKNNSTEGVSDKVQLSPPRVRRTTMQSYLTLSPYGDKNTVQQKHPSQKSQAMRHENNGTDGAQMSNWRPPLQKGVKVAVPIFPIHPKTKGAKRRWVASQFQMGTVVSSQRIYVGDYVGSNANCLSVTIKLDRAYLRNADFAEMSLRVMDDWPSRYMPKCSKVPIGTCVATKYGVGVLVGWRVEDDIHIVRSLWQRRGPGSAHAYLNRNAICSTLEAAVGFEVNTNYGSGVVLAYVDGGKSFQNGKYFVAIKEEGMHHGHVLGVHKSDILTCHGAQFIPIIEHIREAATYQIQLDTYQSALRDQQSDKTDFTHEHFWKTSTVYAEIMWNSFLKAVAEDRDFDEGMNEFMTSVIEFLEKLDESETNNDDTKSKLSNDFIASDFEVECFVANDENAEDSMEPGFWVVNDILGGVFRNHFAENKGKCSAPSPDEKKSSRFELVNEKREFINARNYERAFALIRAMMKTVSIAQASSIEHPHFRMALTISFDFLVFIRTLLKVQRKNLPVNYLEIWNCAFEEIALTFGPIKDRLEKIGRGIAQRMEKQGRKAKIRVLQFVDIVLGDEKLLFALEQADWDHCISRLEIALVKSKIIPEESLFYYRKTAQFVYDHLRSSASSTGSAAARNNEKLAFLAHAVQAFASPRRSILKIFRRDEVLELFERILIRVFCKEEKAARALTIHAANFHSLRHLRMLKNFSVAASFWMPLLDAADEEFSWLVSHMPENSKEFMCPLSSLFSLCVAQFHKIRAGDSSRDWMDFLLEDDAVSIIQDLHMKIILSLESFSRDIREMMEVLPYYPSIDDDILKLMDEVDLDKFLKEASAAIDDPESLAQFLREKATIAVERFLNYLPKMSIPVERRDLGEGWVLTCHGEDGGDLTLSDVKIQRENLVCQILGGDTLFFPMFSDGGFDVASTKSPLDPVPNRRSDVIGDDSILDHIRVLLLQAQSYGCWKSGFGGVGQPPSDRYVAAILQGLPVSSVLNCAIELWRNLEIDDDELLEIAIRDVSFQIQLHSAREVDGSKCSLTPALPLLPAASDSSLEKRLRGTDSHENARRFNPRVDPTVLFLELKKLNLRLDNFRFRIEKSPRKTIFDPVFQGQGMISLQNVSIRLRIDCARAKIKKSSKGPGLSTPILQIRELHVELEKLQMKVQDTGFGSDWLLNRAVSVFTKSITKVVEENLRDQILEQSQAAIDNLNAYFIVHPTILLNILGISMDDLEENVVWV